jgi:ribosomal protein L34
MHLISLISLRPCFGAPDWMLTRMLPPWHAFLALCRKGRRTSGFRVRLSTSKGRKTLNNRRKKGRKVLAPPSIKKSGGKKY